MDEHPEPTTLIDSTTNNYADIFDLINNHHYYFRVKAVDSLGSASPYSNEDSITASISYAYVPGDINGNQEVDGSDVTYGVRYFNGGPPPPDSCWDGASGNWLYVAGDVNGDCIFIGSDITYLVQYFNGYCHNLRYCPNTPPAH